MSRFPWKVKTGTTDRKVVRELRATKFHGRTDDASLEREFNDFEKSVGMKKSWRNFPLNGKVVRDHSRYYDLSDEWEKY